MPNSFVNSPLPLCLDGAQLQRNVSDWRGVGLRVRPHFGARSDDSDDLRLAINVSWRGEFKNHSVEMISQSSHLAPIWNIRILAEVW